MLFEMNYNRKIGYDLDLDFLDELNGAETTNFNITLYRDQDNDLVLEMTYDDEEDDLISTIRYLSDDLEDAENLIERGLKPYIYNNYPNIKTAYTVKL